MIRSCSSWRVRASKSRSRYAWAFSVNSAGIASRRIFLPSSGSKYRASNANRSMTPANGVGLSLMEPEPIGTVIGTGTPSRRSWISARHVVEVGADHVHLVDEHQPRHAVLVGLPPNRFRLGLDAFLGVEDHDRPVENAQRPLDLGREIDVAGRVDQVDRAIAPLERDAGAIDGDAAFLLFGVVVGFGGAGVDGAEPVLGPGVVEQVLGGRGLAGVDVRDDAEVANLVKSIGVGLAAMAKPQSQLSWQIRHKAASEEQSALY